MSMQITLTGLQAAANAGEGGFLINVSRFAITEFPDVVPSEDDTALAGTPVYQGNIDVIEVLDNATIKLTITVPIGVPTTGSWKISELGVFLDTGELFARGAITPVYDKTQDVASSLYVIITAANLGKTINVDITTSISIPSVSTVNLLPDPTTVHQNTFAVLDQMYNSDGTASPSAAIKYGPGGAHWGFVGYDRVYSGPIGDVIDSKSFTLVAIDQGFHLEVQEQVLIQVIAGGHEGSVGETRKCRYEKGVFTVLDGDTYSGLDSSCFISIWKREVPANLIANTIPLPRSYTKKSNGKTKTLTLPFTPVNESYVWVFVDGLFQHKGSYVLKRNVIELLESPGNESDISVEAFELVPGGPGVVLSMYQFKFAVTDNRTVNLPLKITPRNKSYCFVFFGSIFQARDSWTLTENSIRFEEPLSLGYGEIEVVVFEEQVWTNHNMEMLDYADTTNGFSLMQLPTPKSRQLDGGMVFLGSTFQSQESYNTIDNYLQFEGTVPGAMHLQFMEMYKAPPERLLALKSEVDEAIKDVYLVGPFVMRFVRTDGRHFDINLASREGGIGKGTLVLSSSVVNTTAKTTLFVHKGTPNGFIAFSSDDSSIASALNSANPRLDNNGNYEVEMTPSGFSRTVVIAATVNGQFIGSVRLDVVQDSRGSMLTVNGLQSITVAPSTTLFYKLQSGPENAAIKLVDSEGGSVEIGFTNATGDLQYVMRFPALQFGKSRKLSVTAVEIDTEVALGTVKLIMVNNGALFLVNGGVLETVRPGEVLSFAVVGAQPNQPVTWVYTDSIGRQSVQVGTTDATGMWTALKNSESFASILAGTVDISCLVGATIIGVVSLRLLTSLSFLVDSGTTATINRNSRHLFEILNAEPDAPVYWTSSDDDTVKKSIGNTNESGYISFNQTFGNDLGEDRTVTYTAYVNEIATNSVALAIQNPPVVFLVNGLPSALIYPDTTMVFTISNATSKSTITLIRSDTDMLEPVGQADEFGDLTWSQVYPAETIENGKEFTITVASNGEPVGSVTLVMKQHNAARMTVNGGKAAVVSPGAQLTYAVVQGESGLPISLTDTESATLARGIIATNGTFSYTRQYDNNLGVDRTITVYANAENVILDRVHLVVVNNVGTSVRFRANGQTALQVRDGDSATFTVTGARPGALVTWNIPAWNVTAEPIGNIDRNGNLAYVVEYNDSQFGATTLITIEAMVDNAFVGSVSISLVN